MLKHRNLKQLFDARERVKVMRGFKNPESAKALLDLLIVYYNFIRIHQGIRMTPAEMCWVNLNLGQNKWLGLIYRSKITELTSTSKY